MKYPTNLTLIFKKTTNKILKITHLENLIDTSQISILRKPNDPRSGKKYQITGFKNYTQEIEIEIAQVPKKYYKGYKQAKIETLCKTNNKTTKTQFAHL